MFAPWKKSYDQPRQHVKKQRHYSLTKVHIVKAMVFPAVTYSRESWTEKKAEHQRIDAFKLWCWRRLLRVPWTARRSNQSNLREINTEYLLEGMMLKLQYFGHLMWIADSMNKSQMLGRTEGQRRRGSQRIRLLDTITDAMNMNLGKLWDMVRDREAWCASVHGVIKSWIWLDNWKITTNWKDWYWSWSSNILATWFKEPTHWKRLMLGKTECRREGDNTGWDGWMASLTQWTWVWTNSGKQWRIGKPGMLHSMESQQAGHNWATEQQQQINLIHIYNCSSLVNKKSGKS